MQTNSEADAAFNRRDFLKLGMAGSALLALAGVGATLAGCSGRDAATAHGYRFLRDADLALWRALLPALLEGLTLSATQSEEALRRIDGVCFLFRPGGQAQLHRLFDLLNVGLARRWLAGVHAPWPEATLAQKREFLARWRSSRRATFNGGYKALSQLAAVGGYSQPVGWQACRYPGPLAAVYAAANG
jgi:hypothetical protein